MHFIGRTVCQPTLLFGVRESKLFPWIIPRSLIVPSYTPVVGILPSNDALQFILMESRLPTISPLTVPVWVLVDVVPNIFRIAVP